MCKQPVQKWMIQLAVFIGFLTAPGLAFAQGCAMCYNTAAAANAAAIQALRSGILVLLIPPVLIFGAVCGFALRNRNRFNNGKSPLKSAVNSASSDLELSDQEENFVLCRKE